MISFFSSLFLRHSQLSLTLAQRARFLRLKQTVLHLETKMTIGCL
jgi:hypothetical protein